MQPNIIRFDWAIKRLLRNKANFVVLEGFLSSLLNESIKIIKILESEGNKQEIDDKYNRVDILAENSKQELIIIEVQNSREFYYFQRMLYGVSKAITEYIHEGDQYSEVRKIYSVNIVYFDLGQGKDYIYHGYTEFKGIHTGDVLCLSQKQKATFMHEKAGEIFPEYYVLRVNEFNATAITPLDQWIAYLKTGNIPENATAPGLPEARRKLRFDQMSREEKISYERHFENLRIQWDVLTTAHSEGRDEGFAEGHQEGLQAGLQEGIKKGMQEGIQKGIQKGIEKGIQKGQEEGKAERSREIARLAKAQGLSVEMITQLTGLSPEEINQL